jgi:hypothetical protein
MIDSPENTIAALLAQHRDGYAQVSSLTMLLQLAVQSGHADDAMMIHTLEAIKNISTGMLEIIYCDAETHHVSLN